MLRTKVPLASGCAGGLFGAVWIGFWSLGTLLFDGFLIWYCCQQTLALSWPTAPGTITHSEVKAETDSEGTSYKPDVRYRFVVNNVEYSGEGIRLFPAAMGMAHAEAMVRRYPVGKQVPVRYRPQSPDWSLLEAGIGPMEAFLALFLTPFNVIMLGGWTYARNSVIRASRPGLPALRGR